MILAYRYTFYFPLYFRSTNRFCFISVHCCAKPCAFGFKYILKNISTAYFFPSPCGHSTFVRKPPTKPKKMPLEHLNNHQQPRHGLNKNQNHYRTLVARSTIQRHRRIRSRSSSSTAIGGTTGGISGISANGIISRGIAKSSPDHNHRRRRRRMLQCIN